MTLPALRPFSPGVRCPKCNGGDIGQEFEDNAHHPTCSLDAFTIDDGNRECCSVEHVERWCKRCHYKWAERPLDAQQVVADA